MITVTNQEFLEYSGIDLNIELPSDDDSQNKVERFITKCTKRVYRLFTRPTIADSELSDLQEESIKEAICEYVEYILRNGDLSRTSGYDEDKGIVVSHQEIQKASIPGSVVDILRHCGLVKRNIGRSSRISQSLDDTLIG